MKKETQREKIEKLLHYAFACRDVAEDFAERGEWKKEKETTKEMYDNLLATFKIIRKKIK